VSFGAALGLIFTIGVIVIGSRGLPRNLDWPDTIALGLFVLLLAYLLSSRTPSPGSHEGARHGFAFRVGKALKRILYDRRRNTAPRN
jgi:hypothetical protein